MNRDMNLTSVEEMVAKSKWVLEAWNCGLDETVINDNTIGEYAWAEVVAMVENDGSCDPDNMEDIVEWLMTEDNGCDDITDIMVIWAIKCAVKANLPYDYSMI